MLVFGRNRKRDLADKGNLGTSPGFLTGSYTYDNNGNTLTDPSGKSYTWDFENRLTQKEV